MAPRHKPLDIPTFSGANLEVDSFESFIIRVNVAMGANNWSSKETADRVITRLQGKAASKLTFASPAETASWESLQIFLSEHFVPRSDVAMNLAQFQSRIQRQSESYIDFAGALRVILKRAFPLMLGADKEKMLTTQFTNGIQNTVVQGHLTMTDDLSLSQAVTKAERWDITNQTQRLTTPLRKLGSVAFTGDPSLLLTNTEQQQSK
jgi:hypothetical protein